MMALMLGTFETCACALVICEPIYKGWSASLFFMFEACGTHGATGRVARRSPPSREAGFGAVGHAAHQNPQL
jgi:hypothetical protein